VNDAPTIPLDAQPLPQDWEQQVLAEWMAVTAVTQGESYAPADRNESCTLRLEKAEITGTVTVSFIRETYVSPQIQSAAETRTGELNAGAVTGWDGEKSQGWNLTCLSEDGRSRWIISMMEDVRSRLLRVAGMRPAEYAAVLMAGPCAFALEAALTTLIPEESRVLVVCNGARAEAACRMLARADIAFEKLETGFEQAAGAAEIAMLLDERPDITHVAVVHVDAGVSFRATSIDAEALGIDVLLSVADCGLKGVSGLSFVLARRNILESSEGRARSVSLDLFKGLRRQEAGIENSLPPQAVSALHAALDALDKEGGSAVRETSCRAAAEKLAAGMIRLGFEPCLEEDARSPHVLSFLHPSDTFSFEHLQCVLRAAGWLIASAAIENRSVVSLSTLSGIDDT